MTRAELLRLRRILRCPIIESFSRLPTQESCPHHLTKSRTWSIFGVLEFLHQHFRYRQGRVKADVIEELQGSHWPFQPQGHSLVDVLGVRDPLAHKQRGFVQGLDEDPIDYEARRV